MSHAEAELQMNLSIARGQLLKFQRRLGQLSGQIPLFDEAAHKNEVRFLEGKIKRLLAKEAVLIEQIENWQQLDSAGLYKV